MQGQPKVIKSTVTQIATSGHCTFDGTALTGRKTVDSQEDSYMEILQFRQLALLFHRIMPGEFEIMFIGISEMF